MYKPSQPWHCFLVIKHTGMQGDLKELVLELAHSKLNRINRTDAGMVDVVDVALQDQ